MRLSFAEAKRNLFHHKITCDLCIEITGENTAVTDSQIFNHLFSCKARI